MPNTSVAARLRRRTLPSTLKIISAAGIVSMVASRSACDGLETAARLGGDARELAGFAQGQRQLALAQLQRLHHLRERIDQHADLIAAQRLVRGAEVAALNAVGGGGQLGERIEHDALGREHQPHHQQHRAHEDGRHDREKDLAAPGEEPLGFVRDLALAAIEILEQRVDRREVPFAHRQQKVGVLQSIHAPLHVADHLSNRVRNCCSRPRCSGSWTSAAWCAR